LLRLETVSRPRRRDRDHIPISSYSIWGKNPNSHDCLKNRSFLCCIMYSTIINALAYSEQFSRSKFSQFRLAVRLILAYFVLAMHVFWLFCILCIFLVSLESGCQVITWKKLVCCLAVRRLGREKSLLLCFAAESQDKLLCR